MYIVNDCTTGTIPNQEIDQIIKETKEAQIAQPALKPHMTEKTKRVDVLESIQKAKEALIDPELQPSLKRPITEHLQNLERTLERQKNPLTVMVDFSPKSMKRLIAKKPKKVVQIKAVKRTKKPTLPTHTTKGQKIVRAIFSK